MSVDEIAKAISANADRMEELAEARELWMETLEDSPGLMEALRQIDLDEIEAISHSLELRKRLYTAVWGKYEGDGHATHLQGD